MQSVVLDAWRDGVSQRSNILACGRRKTSGARIHGQPIQASTDRASAEASEGGRTLDLRTRRPRQREQMSRVESMVVPQLTQQPRTHLIQTQTPTRRLVPATATCALLRAEETAPIVPSALPGMPLAVTVAHQTGEPKTEPRTTLRKHNGDEERTT